MMKDSRWHTGLLALFLIFFFWGLNAQFPLLGHDYYYYWPRLLEGKWHFLRQGLWPLRFAVHLCGGFPQYGNPQDLFYSLPQLLSFFLDLWTASQLSILVAMLVGYVGWVRFGKDAMGIPSSWARVLALVCTANGFFFVHIAVGHLSYFTLPLMSWLLWAFFHRQRESGWLLVERAVLFAAIVGIFLFSGTYIAPFIVLPLMFFLVPFDLLLSAESMSARAMTLARRAAVFTPIVLALGASKLVAVYSLMRVLPRTVAFYQYTADQNVLLFALKSLWFIPQLPGFFTLTPVNRIHEESMFTSPVALIGTCVLLFLLVRSPTLVRWKKAVLLGYALAVAGLILSVVHGVGIVPTALQTLPGFSSIRVPERFLVILSLLFSVGGCAGFARIFQHERWAAWEKRTALVASAVTVMAFIGAYAPLVRSLEYTLPYDLINALVHAQPDPLMQPVTVVEDFRGIKISDFQYFFNRSTGSRCYETIQSSTFPPLRDGPVNLAWDGAVNVYNPSCIQYGAENGCKPGDRIRIDDLKNLERFVNGEPTTWRLSTAQMWADRLTVMTLLGLALFGGLSVWRSLRRRNG